MAKLGLLLLLSLVVACTHGAAYATEPESQQDTAIVVAPGSEIVGAKDALGDLLAWLTAVTGVDIAALIVQFPKSIVGIMAIMDYANSAYTQLLIDSQLLPRLDEIIRGAVNSSSLILAPIVKILSKVLSGTATAIDLLQLTGLVTPTLTKLQGLLLTTVQSVDRLVDELMLNYGDEVKRILEKVLTEIWIQLEPLADILRPVLPGLPGGPSSTF